MVREGMLREANAVMQKYLASTPPGRVPPPRKILIGELL
jgi:hypothetical protein